jgi:hypothetical protein
MFVQSPPPSTPPRTEPVARPFAAPPAYVRPTFVAQPRAGVQVLADVQTAYDEQYFFDRIAQYFHQEIVD